MQSINCDATNILKIFYNMENSIDLYTNALTNLKAELTNNIDIIGNTLDYKVEIVNNLNK